MTILNPASIKLIGMILSEIPTAIDIVKRLQAGDQTAEQQAKDWLGITTEVDEAIKDWNETPAQQAEGTSGT